MRLPILYKRTKTTKIQFWEIYTEDKSGAGQITKTSGQYGTQNPLVNTELITQGKNLGRTNVTTPIEQADCQALSDWNKKKDQGYKDFTDLGVKFTDSWQHAGITYSNLKSALEAALPKYNSDASGNVKPVLALPVNWAKVTYPCYVQRKYDGCVYGKTLISTDKGLLKIEDIVQNRMEVNVLSYNESSQSMEYKPILNWFNNGKAAYTDWVDITLNTGTRLKTTTNHKYLTKEGWKEAKDLNPKEDLIYTNSFSDYRTSLLFGTLLGDTTLCIDKRVSASSYRINFSHTNKDLLDFKINILNLEGSITEYITGYGSKAYRFVSKALSKTDFPVDRVYFVGHTPDVGKRKFIPYLTLYEFMGKEALSLWIADDGSLRLNNGNPHTPVLNISTHRFSIEQIDIFVEYFTKVWHCTPSKVLDKRVDTSKCSGLSLNFNTKDTLFLLNHLKSFQCKGVEYKYYFPTESYISQANNEFKWNTFHKCNSRFSSNNYTKYDLEIADNHNYIANGIVIHNCRSLLNFDGQTITFLSRTGKEYTTLGHIRDEVLPTLTEPIILDGEIYSHDLTFQEIIAAVKKQRPDSLKLKLRVYDVVNDQTQLKREALVRELTSTKAWATINAVDTFTCNSKEEVIQLHDQFVGEGYEGAMIRLLDGMYAQGQRSQSLMKVKVFDTTEYNFVEFVLGQRGVEDLIARCSNGDLTFRAKMQGTVAEKQALYDYKVEEGAVITIKHHGLTDDGLPRFPIGIGIRDYE